MKMTAVVRLAARIVDHPAFGRTVMALILLAAVVVGLETYPASAPASPCSSASARSPPSSTS